MNWKRFSQCAVKGVASLLAMITILVSLCACDLDLPFFKKEKSDQEMIEARITAFIKAYNAGDSDAVLECLDARTRNTFKALLRIGGSVIQKKSGIQLALADLFTLGVGFMSEDDIMTVSDISIREITESKATVDVKFHYQDKVSEMDGPAVFTMVKEDGDWFIRNLQG